MCRCVFNVRGKRRKINYRAAIPDRVRHRGGASLPLGRMTIRWSRVWAKQRLSQSLRPNDGLRLALFAGIGARVEAVELDYQESLPAWEILITALEMPAYSNSYDPLRGRSPLGSTGL